jgi:hypothetical protein
MSPGELVRSWWESPDRKALVAACEPGVEWDLRRFEGWDGDPVPRGPDGVRAVLDRLPWATGGTCVPCGHKRGIRDGEQVEEVGGLVYAVRPDGKMDRWTVFPSPEQAWAWIGLRQAPAEAQ